MLCSTLDTFVKSISQLSSMWETGIDYAPSQFYLKSGEFCKFKPTQKLLENGLNYN